MDLITTAILTALSSGVVASVQKVGEQALVDAYTALKELIKRKFGTKSEIMKAVKEVEKTDSPGRKEVLREEVTNANADKDPELIQAAQKIMDIIKNTVDGTSISQNAVGDGNIQIAGDGNIVQTTMPRTKR